MLQQRYSYSDTVRQSGLYWKVTTIHSAKYLQYSMYKMYEHASKRALSHYANTHKYMTQFNTVL